MLISLYVQHQRSFDRFVPNNERVFRVVGEIEMEGQGELSSNMVFGLGPTLLHDHPELIGRLYRWFDFQDPQHTLKVGDSLSTVKMFTESGLYLVDSTVFDIFSYPLVAGDARAALTKPGSIVLSQEMAKKYFGDADPMSQIDEVGQRDGRASNRHPRRDATAHQGFDLVVLHHHAVLAEHRAAQLGVEPLLDLRAAE